MFQLGSKIKHVKTANYISEMADQFNVVGTGGDTPDSHRVVLIVGRNEVEISEETLVEVEKGKVQAQTLPESLSMTKKVFANITMSVDSAKQLVAALQQAIDQADSLRKNGQ